jgi:hypothetical protein
MRKVFVKNYRCIVCLCGLEYKEIERGFRKCAACSDADAEKRSICEDREVGGYDTVSHMRLLEHGDPSRLAGELRRMGVLPDGDDLGDDDFHFENR